MKIFHKKYVRAIHCVNNLEELIDVLSPWIDDVLYIDSVFLEQVSYYLLPKRNSLERIFKRTLGNYLYLSYGHEDFKQIVFFAIVRSYRKFDPNKGCDLINWMSWTIPSYVCRLLRPNVIRHINFPFSEVPNSYVDFDTYPEDGGYYLLPDVELSSQVALNNLEDIIKKSNIPESKIESLYDLYY